MSRCPEAIAVLLLVGCSSKGVIAPRAQSTPGGKESALFTTVLVPPPPNAKKVQWSDTGPWYTALSASGEVLYYAIGKDLWRTRIGSERVERVDIKPQSGENQQVLHEIRTLGQDHLVFVVHETTTTNHWRSHLQILNLASGQVRTLFTATEDWGTPRNRPVLLDVENDGAKAILWEARTGKILAIGLHNGNAEPRLRLPPLTRTGGTFQVAYSSHHKLVAYLSHDLKSQELHVADASGENERIIWTNKSSFHIPRGPLYVVGRSMIGVSSDRYSSYTPEDRASVLINTDSGKVLKIQDASIEYVDSDDVLVSRLGFEMVSSVFNRRWQGLYHATVPQLAEALHSLKTVRVGE